MADKILFDESYLAATHAVGGRLDDPAEIAELRERIERTVAPVTEPRAPASAERSDRLVPLAAVGGAVIAIAVAALLALTHLDREVDDMALKFYGHSSGEGRVLQQYRADSERRIQQKDSEVRSVLEQLEALRRRSADLTTVVEKGLQIRENQMTAEAEAQLARERAQLAAHGTAEAEAEARIATLRERLERESRAELERMRRQADAALAAQRTQLLASVAKATDELARVAQERMGVPSAVSAAPVEAVPPPPQEMAVTHEIASGLAEAVASIERSDYEEAAALLSRVRDLLSGGRASQAPSVVARRAADLRIIEALEGYVSVLRAQQEPKPAAAAPAPAPQPVAVLGPIIGRVTLVDGRRVVIEALVATPVGRDALVQIVRLDAARNRHDVICARVVEVSGTRIVADVEGDAFPSVTDAVHLPGRQNSR